MTVGCRAGIRTRIFPVNSRTCCRCHHPTNGRVGRTRTSTRLRPRQVGCRLPYDPKNELSGLVAGEGIEPPCAVCRTAVLPLNEPAVGRGGGNRTRMVELMRLPRSPSLPSAAVRQQSSPSWRGQRDSNPYSRADNAASSPSTMSPSEWSARGESNPDLHGLNVPRLPIAPRADRN